MSKTKTLTLIVVVVALIGIGGFILASRNESRTASTQTNATPSTPAAATESAKSETEKKYESYTGEEYDRYYVANMIMHHMGAVHMAELAKTSAKHDELKTLAGNIITSQTAEIDNMRQWQKDWNYPASEGAGMMDHSAMGMEDDMNGMMMELQGKTGDDFDKAFLREMIEHHQSAIDMSKPAATNAQHQEVKDLAAAVIAAQSKEITQMKQWQKDWGYVRN